MKQNGPIKGSFGIPKEIQEAINESKSKKTKDTPPTEEYVDAESIPEEVTSENQNKSQSGIESESPEAESQDKKDEALAAQIREELGIELDEDDLWQFYFGTLEKKNIVVVPGKIHVTFRLIDMESDRKISEHMSVALEKKLLENGFRHLNTQHILSYGLTEIGKPGKVKSLGKDPEERFQALSKFNTLLIEKLSQRWNNFIWLVNHTVSKEMDLKKS